MSIFGAIGSTATAAAKAGFNQIFGSGTSDNPTLGDMVNNAFTGSLDYARQKELMDYQYNLNSAAAAADRAFNAAEAQKNRDYQERLSNTQYLRAAEQLKQLGINPAVLAGSADSSALPAGSSSSSHSNSVSGASWSRSRSNALSSIASLTRAVASIINVAAVLA